MDYEQKYKESLERAKDQLDGAKVFDYDNEQIAHDIRTTVYSIFPELKKLEDEKIRKELIDAIQGLWENDALPMPLSVKRKDNWLAWLEKIGEQKPADKVEPKFHEGEWLCENEPNNYARFIQILETVNVQGKERYRISRDIHNDEDVVEFDFVEKYYHKFDIKDAKDGDVLVHNSFMFDDFIFIYNSTSILQVCCYYSKERNRFIVEDGGHHYPWNMEEVTPATKEQRDSLDKAMADAGYTFDFDKKELKKIEQEPTECKEKKYSKCYVYNLPHNDEMCEQCEFNPKNKKPVEWSEEDEMITLSIEQVMNCASLLNIVPEKIDKIRAWLKSLKERYTWKPSDEQIERLNGIINSLPHQEVLYSLYQDLKNLKE